MILTPQDDNAYIAAVAVQHLLTGKLVQVFLKEDQRPAAFPLPVKRVKPAHGRTGVIQEYRPLALLEYVQDVVSGKQASEEAKARAKSKDQSPAPVAMKE